MSVNVTSASLWTGAIYLWNRVFRVDILIREPADIQRSLLSPTLDT